MQRSGARHYDQCIAKPRNTSLTLALVHPFTFAFHEIGGLALDGLGVRVVPGRWKAALDGRAICGGAGSGGTVPVCASLAAILVHELLRTCK